MSEPTRKRSGSSERTLKGDNKKSRSGKRVQGATATKEPASSTAMEVDSAEEASENSSECSSQTVVPETTDDAANLSKDHSSDVHDGCFHEHPTVSPSLATYYARHEDPLRSMSKDGCDDELLRKGSCEAAYIAWTSTFTEGISYGTELESEKENVPPLRSSLLSVDKALYDNLANCTIPLNFTDLEDFLSKEAIEVIASRGITSVGELCRIDKETFDKLNLKEPKLESFQLIMRAIHNKLDSGWAQNETMIEKIESKGIKSFGDIISLQDAYKYIRQYEEFRLDKPFPFHDVLRECFKGTRSRIQKAAVVLDNIESRAIALLRSCPRTANICAMDVSKAGDINHVCVLTSKCDTCRLQYLFTASPRTEEIEEIYDCSTLTDEDTLKYQTKLLALWEVKCAIDHDSNAFSIDKKNFTDESRKMLRSWCKHFAQLVGHLHFDDLVLVKHDLINFKSAFDSLIVTKLRSVPSSG